MPIALVSLSSCLSVFTSRGATGAAVLAEDGTLLRAASAAPAEGAAAFGGAADFARDGGAAGSVVRGVTAPACCRASGGCGVEAAAVSGCAGTVDSPPTPRGLARAPCAGARGVSDCCGACGAASGGCCVDGAVVTSGGSVTDGLWARRPHPSIGNETRTAANANPIERNIPRITINKHRQHQYQRHVSTPTRVRRRLLIRVPSFESLGRRRGASSAQAFLCTVSLCKSFERFEPFRAANAPNDPNLQPIRTTKRPFGGSRRSVERRAGTVR